MKKPIIGITPQYDYERNRIWIHPNYLAAIKHVGGIPCLLPLETSYDDVKQMIDFFDGFLFPGGPDVDPFFFHEETIPEGGVVVPQRDHMEQLVFLNAYEANKPILGICRGIQVFNIFLGGTIFQDLGAQFLSSRRIGHYQKSADEVRTHRVRIEPDSLLDQILGKKDIKVNSFHHQGIRDLAPTLEIAATSFDSLIEAVFDPSKKFLLGLQWHPEHLFSFDKDQEKLFHAFVKAC